VDATSDNIADLVDSLNDAIEAGEQTGDFSGKKAIQEQMERENELREKALELQEKLIYAQVDYFKARAERIRSGQELFKIVADGSLEPTLKELLRNLIKLVQIEGNIEDFDELFGSNQADIV
jgi:hypothetical protein